MADHNPNDESSSQPPATGEPESSFTGNSQQPPHKLRRRQVLKIAGAAAAVGAVGAGGYLGYDRYQRLGRSEGAGELDRRVKRPGSSPKMVIARGSSAEANVKAALERMGGMKTFVEPDEVVLLKPNIAFIRSPMHAATTNPEVVAALVRACLDAGAKQVLVTDCSVQDAQQCFERTEIGKAAAKAGAKVVRPDESSYQVVELSKNLGAWDVLAPFVTADKIINVPIVKHHHRTGVTAGMKNWIGITGTRRRAFHANLDRTIVELAALMRPTLTVLDAIRVLKRNGPRGGNLADVKKLNTIAMSVDPVAADAWATDLLGFPQSEVAYLELAEKMKLGTVDYNKLDPPEINTG